MILSKEDMFCEKQTTSASAAASTNVLDFHKLGDDVMRSMSWSAFCESAAANATLDVKWQTSDTEDFSSSTDVWDSGTIATTSLTKGARIVDALPIPKGLKRYNRLYLTGTAGASGTPAYPKITAFLHDGRDEGQPYRG